MTTSSSTHKYTDGDLSLSSLTSPFFLSASLPSLLGIQNPARGTGERFMVHFERKIMPPVTQIQQATTQIFGILN